MKYYVELGDKEIGIEVLHALDGTVVKLIEAGDEGHATLADFAAVHCNINTGEGLYSLIADGKSYQLYVEPQERGFRTALWRQRFDLKVLTEREWRLKKVAPRQSGHSGEVNIKAPMPGLVKGVLVSVGDSVTMGQRLVVLEAMKMENDITSPANGKVTRVDIEPGTVVEGGKALLSIEA